MILHTSEGEALRREIIARAAAQRWRAPAVRVVANGPDGRDGWTAEASEDGRQHGRARYVTCATERAALLALRASFRRDRAPVAWGQVARWLAYVAVWALFAWALRVAVCSTAPPWAVLALLVTPALLVTARPRPAS